jgi:hypothetical protein
MAESMGLCAILANVDSLRPQVFGMGILVNDFEILTCAHVIDQVLGSTWQSSKAPAVVGICFPFLNMVSPTWGVVAWGSGVLFAASIHLAMAAPTATFSR